MSCSTSNRVTPSARSCRSTSDSARFSLCRKPAAGSSSSSSEGSVHKARAISIKRCGPKARLPANSCMRSSMPMRLSCRWASAKMRRSSALSSASMACTVLALLRRYAPKATFSSTVISGIIFTCWKVREMPCCAMPREGKPARDWPRQRTPPEVSGKTPVIRLKVVLLPAPLGPIKPTISPASMWKLTSLTATKPPNSFRTWSTSNSRWPLGGLGSWAIWSASVQSTLRGTMGRRFWMKVHKPSGAYLSTRIKTTPKTMTSKLPLEPNKAGSKTCNSSSMILTTPAPRKAPQTWPTPPSTAMNRYSMPLFRPNGVGFTVRWKCANSQPEMAASTAAKMKAMSL